MDFIKIAAGARAFTRAGLQKCHCNNALKWFSEAPRPEPGSAQKVFLMIRSYQGHTPQVPASCYVDLSAQLIGDVALGEHSSVWMNAVLRGDVHSIRVGSHSNVQDCAVLHGQRNLYSVTVGDWVTIGHNATVHGCVVEDECLIGIGARVLNDCRIGSGSIIAAGAVEHSVVPPRTLWAGVPAKMRRELSDADRKLILEYAKNYLDYTQFYLAEGLSKP
jgi:carbonic anhydrase/acetyltransferase-like protein (isoleucine patch superfamily)